MLPSPQCYEAGLRVPSLQLGKLQLRVAMNGARAQITHLGSVAQQDLNLGPLTRSGLGS